LKYSKYSAIIIGSGVAGLYLALKLDAQKNLKDGILVITKSKLDDSNSRFAQGGIVAVMGQNKMDSVSLHVSDTLRSGCGLVDFNVATFISQNSEQVINDLLKLGVPFDKDKNGLFFGLEAAHTIPRILHAGGDATGERIEHTLCEKIRNNDNIEVYENTMAVELLTNSSNECIGVLVYREATDSYEAIYSNAVVLASGGVGQVYKHTTNPDVTTGDGLALAKRVNAEISNMEFIQFHPTALNIEGGNKPLVSEAVRGEGALLVDKNGTRFMNKYDLRAELAPRDIVSRAIFNEGSSVYLDISPIGLDKFKNRFPNISKVCMEYGINLEDGLIPVAPAAHYCMGGVKTKISGETNVNNLFAIGEVACTGLHGANRLASNSLLECVVCAWELSNTLSLRNLDAPKKIDDKVKKTLKLYDEEADYIEVDTDSLIASLKEIMWDKVGILRDEKSLLQAKFEIAEIKKEFRKTHRCQNRREYELRNLIEVANLIVDSALNRRESVGAHYRLDSMQDSENINNTKEEILNYDNTIFIK